MKVLRNCFSGTVLVQCENTLFGKNVYVCC